MRTSILCPSLAGLLGAAIAVSPLVAQAASPPAAPGGASSTGAASDPVAILVSRLDLERYKATIKGLTQFGDRRQGTERNRAAIDWIESQLKSYGCSNTERLRYVYSPDEKPQPSGTPKGPGPDGAVGGGHYRGMRAPTGVNVDPMRQPDEKLRALDTPPSVPGPREEVYCTKIGTTHPEEMYIVGAHMDGHGWGEAANDDGSGSAFVMELARVLRLTRCADGTFHPLHPVEQRGDGTERRLRLCGAARCAAGARGTARIRTVPGAALARHDPARHDAVRSWDAPGGRHGRQESAARGGRQHRIPVAGEAGGRRTKTGVGACMRRTNRTRPTIRRPSART